MDTLPNRSASKRRQPARATSAELIALGRAYRGKQLTLDQYRDLVSVALRHWNGTLRAGRFAEQRASGFPGARRV